MADGGVVRRRREAPERVDYIRDFDRLRDFVDNELGNGRAPRPIPDPSEWRIQRAKTIQRLNELREKLDTICVGANYGKAAGNGAEILGAVTAIAGAIMSLGGLPSGRTVMNAGNLVRDAGTLIDGVSNVVESLGSANYLNDIEKVLKRDQELSRPFAEWLNYTRELDVTIERIFGVSLASEKFNTVMKVFYEFSKFSNSVKGFDATMSLMRQGRYSVHVETDVALEKLQKFFQHLSVSPQLANGIRLTLSVLSVSTVGLQVFRDGARMYRSIMGTSTSSVVPSLLGGLHPDIPTGMQVTGFCLFQAITIGISVILLINAANIIKHGKSKYSDAIDQLTRVLAWELTQMENM